MKICKNCGTNNADVVIKCYGCNSGSFLMADTKYFANEKQPTQLTEFIYSTRYQLQYNDTSRSWELWGNDHVVQFPDFGIIKPTDEFVKKGDLILDDIMKTILKIEEGINHIISKGHSIRIKYIELMGDSAPNQYDIHFEVIGSGESEYSYPFMCIYAEVNESGRIEIRIEYI
jgi:hypothetical protein